MPNETPSPKLGEGWGGGSVRRVSLGLFLSVSSSMSRSIESPPAASTWSRMGALAKLKPDEIEAFYRRAGQGHSGTARRARLHQSLHPAGRGGAVAPRRPTSRVNKATEPLFKVADTPEKMLKLGEGEAEGLHQDHRPLQHQGQERDRAVAHPGRATSTARCRATARPCRRCPASGARPPMWCSTSRSASRPSRSTRTSSASATAPASRRARTRSRSNWQLEKRVPEKYKQPRPSLADPARPLCVQGAQAGMPALRGHRYLRLSGEDDSGRRAAAEEDETRRLGAARLSAA